MAWRAQRIDEENHILRAVRLVGFVNMDPKGLELILNLAYLVKDKGADTTIRDITMTEDCVKGLFEESTAKEEEKQP